MAHKRQLHNPIICAILSYMKLIAQAKLLQILLSLVIGYEVARFFLDYLSWSLIIGQVFS